MLRELARVIHRAQRQAFVAGKLCRMPDLLSPDRAKIERNTRSGAGRIDLAREADDGTADVFCEGPPSGSDPRKARRFDRAMRDRPGRMEERAASRVKRSARGECARV